MTRLPNPLVPGFNPDPSVVAANGRYYLVTSTFEYLPGIPVHESTDLVHWELVAHVGTDPAQLQVGEVGTGGGVWAPTIRWRDGVFHVIVTVAMGRGMVVFSATDPRGPWSAGTPIDLSGIDPDLAWDTDGTAIVTFSGLQLPEGVHLGIQQARVDLATGRAFETPRSLWSGTGLMFPEAPHLYRIGEHWYLVIAEGGTERGHTVSVARSDSPYGPFEGCPANPVLSARSTARPVQNTGHGDLVQAPDGSWHLVLLGMRVKGLTRSFAALGRETFATPVDWVDGWPRPRPVELDDELPAPVFDDPCTSTSPGLEWIAVRRLPADAARWTADGVVLTGEGRTMDHRSPTFVGRRQRRLDARITAEVDATDGVGGLSIRYDEEHHYDVEVGGGVDGCEVVVRACVPSLRSEWRQAVAPGRITLFAEMRPTAGVDFRSRMSCDTIALGAVTADGTRHVVAELDGRFLSAESACSFTGRVVGAYCVSGTVVLHHYREGALEG